MKPATTRNHKTIPPFLYPLLRRHGSNDNSGASADLDDRGVESDMRPAIRRRLRLSAGTELSFITAGQESKPAVLLLHGFPGSAGYFREVVPELSQAAYVIAPDLPGFGESDVLPSPSFSAFGAAVSELLERLAVGRRYVYLHDFGAPAGFDIALQAPNKSLVSSFKTPTLIEPGSGRHGRRSRTTGRIQIRKTRRLPRRI